MDRLLLFNRACLATVLREGMNGAVVACVRQHLGRTGEGHHQVFFQSVNNVWDTDGSPFKHSSTGGRVKEIQILPDSLLFFSSTM